MFAKLASARNKPNKQTLVPASAVPHLLQTVPLRDYRGLGGKFGEEVQANIQPAAYATDIQAKAMHCTVIAAMKYTDCTAW
jgi:nucleotidyltransferase/DNA polymerase involved in DNA repair